MLSILPRYVKESYMGSVDEKKVAAFRASIVKSDDVVRVAVRHPALPEFRGYRYKRSRSITVNGVDYRSLPTFGGCYVSLSGSCVSANRVLKKVVEFKGKPCYKVFNKLTGKWESTQIWKLVGLAWNGDISRVVNRDKIAKKNDANASSVVAHKNKRKAEFVMYYFDKDFTRLFRNYDELRAGTGGKLPANKLPSLPKVIKTKEHGVCLITTCGGDMSRDALRQLTIDIYYKYTVTDTTTGEVSLYRTTREMWAAVRVFGANMSVERGSKILAERGLIVGTTSIKYHDKKYTMSNTSTGDIISGLSYMALVARLGVTRESINARFRPTHSCYRKPINGWELTMEE